MSINTGAHYPLPLEKLPRHWRVGYVGDFTKKIEPGFASGEHNQSGSGVPHLRPMNIDRNGKIDLSVVKSVAATKDLRRLAIGDVLFNNTNSPELVGKTTVITQKAEFAFSNHMTRIAFNEDVLPQFGALQLHFLWMRGFFKYNCVKHVNQASISSGTLSRTVPFVWAPIEEQRAIVAEIEKQFSRLDEAVANLQRVKANLKRYIDSVYAEVFGEEPNCSLGDLIEEGPQNGLYLPKEMYGEGVSILRIDDYQTAWIRPLAELRRVKATPDQISTWAMREGDLVINRVNSMTHLGKCALIPAALVGTVFESNMMRMRLNNDVLPKYVEHYLASRLGKTRLTENAKWAVNQASINQKDVRATPIFVPDRDAQQEIVADVDRRLSIIKGTEIEVDANIKRAQALRQSVLQRAFSGEITFRDSRKFNIAQVEPLIAPHSFPTEPVSVVMAARIIAANCNEVTFGRVKLQKMLYLATHHGQVHAANDEYARKQAGPLDMQMLGGVIKRLDDLRWFREAERAGKSPRDKAYSYSALTKADDHKRHLHVLTPAQQKVIDDLSLLMRTWSTEDCELFATVYAAWNDLILLKHELTVEAITYEVRENWHESKKRFSTTQVSGMIDKIKRLGYEPTGFGRPTSGKEADTQTGELF